MPESFKLINLTDIPMVWKIYSGVTIKKRNSRVNRWIKQQIQQINEKYSKKEWRKSTLFSGYVELHDKYSETKGIPSSSENMIDFIVKRNSVPNINTFVDIYNVVSALTGISMGAHDINRIVGNARLEEIGEDIQFRMIGKSGKDIARKGEYCYTDEKGILCRLDIKQSERTKIVEETHDILAIFQGHYYLGEKDLREGLQFFDEILDTLK